MATNWPEQQLHRFRNRTTPFFIIVLFSAAASGVRIFLIPEFSLATHLFLFLFQVVILAAIWLFISWLNDELDKRLPFSSGPLRRVGMQILLTLLAVAPVIIAIALLVAPYVPHFVTPQFVAIGIALLVVIIFLFNFGFYAFYFFSNWQRSVEEKSQLQIQALELEKEKSMLQYHQLRNQVNPHFLFNTLTSLDGLVLSDPELASRFIRHLSKVYRYVLEHKESEVVLLETELNFIGHYISLLQIKHQGGLRIELDISPQAKEKGIAMVTLQMLIDNAIKHNTVHPASPLVIQIRDADEYLSVKNNKQLRRQIEDSTRLGLQQLKQLYHYLSDRSVEVVDRPESFEVKLPLL